MKETPLLAAMAKRNPFCVPDGYFDDLENNVRSSIFLDKLVQQTDKNAFEVPAGYFDTLTEQIETSVHLESLIAEENPFHTPAHYFDSLEARITHKIEVNKPRKATKIVALWNKNLFKYASAACFLIASSFFLYFYESSQSVVKRNNMAAFSNEQLLYDIDEHTIIEHLESRNTDAPKAINASTNTEIENYILRNYSSSDLAQEL